MFIFVEYKDAPELSAYRRLSTEEEDTSIEKQLLVNPKCYVRVMLEYIRKQCKLAANTQFDLCDENGCLRGLFGYNTYAYADEQFEHKKSYYLIVLKTESDKSTSILPQLNRENKFYPELQARVQHFLASGDMAKSSVAVTKKK